MANILGFEATASPFSDDDDDRSSSLSDLDEGTDTGNTPAMVDQKIAATDVDSEAETERLEISPNKPLRVESGPGSSVPLDQPFRGTFNESTDAQRTAAERFSDSAISSPVSSDEELLSEGNSDHTEPQEGDFDGAEASKLSAGIKRKRTSQENGSGIDQDEENRSRRKRTGSIRSDAGHDRSSDDEGSSNGDPSRNGTPDAMDVIGDQDDELVVAANSDDRLIHSLQVDEDLIAQSTVGKPANTHATGYQNEDSDGLAVSQPEEEQAGIVEESDEEDLAEPDDVEDAEAAARSEEEHAKRSAAMEALLALEKRFATLRDRLYDERIAAINNDLSQLSGPHPTHPELLRQVQVVQQSRDEKFDIEQRLLVFKIGTLKRKSIAERSQIHSAYFQTIRDVRERHLEKASEFFYRIQRDRFKTDESVPSYSIPFPTRRSQQITQQMSYNKEVSILSGVAKYVGFPAAPEIVQARPGELDDDMEKMGITPNPLRNSRPVQSSILRPGFSAALSQPAAEEQFLEQTPWANPQHPAHHQHLNRTKHPASGQPRRQESLATPAGQKSQLELSAVAGSASTIPEIPSAQVSSTIKPQPQPSSHGKHTIDAAADPLVRRTSEDAFRRSESASPTVTRKAYSATLLNPNSGNVKHNHDLLEASSQGPRVNLYGSPPRASISRTDYEPRRQTASPITFNQHSRENGLTSRTGLGGIGAR